ncbi:hypothetical protein T7740_20490 [Bradyrhizobium diazoefficiens]|nr:hypothetical protein [Bradyrhizobium diazoefficiens]WRJ68947.1 hypothetical protein T7740_20490 [Bradyrhizobium diazoefficiens]
MVERVTRPAWPNLATIIITEQIGKPVQRCRPLIDVQRAIVQRNDRREARQAGRRFEDALGDRNSRIPSLRSKAAEEHHGLERGEPRQDSGYAHLRRAAGKRPANRGGRQTGNDRLGIVACDCHDVVAAAHTEPLQRLCQSINRDA